MERALPFAWATRSSPFRRRSHSVVPRSPVTRGGSSRSGSGPSISRGKVLLTEALGSEILAHVEVNATPVVSEDVVEGSVVDQSEQEVAADLMSESGNGHRTTFVGRLDPA